jgi:hypothetical protein
VSSGKWKASIAEDETTYGMILLRYATNGYVPLGFSSMNSFERGGYAENDASFTSTVVPKSTQTGPIPSYQFTENDKATATGVTSS